MTNKKILLLCISIVLVLSLFGCSKTDNDPIAENDSDSQSLASSTYTSDTQDKNSEASSADVNPTEEVTHILSDDTAEDPQENGGDTTDSNVQNAPQHTEKPCTITVGETDYTASVGDVVTYKFTLKTPEKIENVQAILSYDSATLMLQESNATSMFPVLGSSCVYNSGLSNTIKFNASNISGYDFTDEDVLVTVSFKVLRGGSTSINTAIEFMDEKGGEAYIDNFNIIGNITLKETLSV